MNNYPLISVVIPLYNKEKSIRRTIRSVLDQTYSHFELVVVDDGSTDMSLELARSFDDERITVFERRNEGVSSARNFGARNCISDWIVFLDADDIFLPNALEVLHSLTHIRSVKFVSCNFYREIGDRQTIAVPNSHDGFLGNGFKSWVFGECLPRTGCSMVSRELCLKYPFNTMLSRFEDAEVVFELFRNTKIAVSSTPILVFQQEFNELSRVYDYPEKDFAFHLIFKKKTFWEKVALASILYSGFVSYKKFRLRLLFQYKLNFLYVVVFYFILKFLKKNI